MEAASSLDGLLIAHTFFTADVLATEHLIVCFLVVYVIEMGLMWACLLLDHFSGSKQTKTVIILDYHPYSHSLKYIFKHDLLHINIS